MKRNKTRVINASGTPYERSHQHGEQCCGDVRHYTVGFPESLAVPLTEI